MKTMIVCLIVVLSCSCQQKSCERKISRHEEVLRIMRDDYISDILSWDSCPDEQKKALLKIQNDFYAKGTKEQEENGLYILVPGPEWKLRGPLTPEEATAELIRWYEEQQDLWNEELRDYDPNKSWSKFTSQYRDGDEIYWFCSSDYSWVLLGGKMGYVLIRESQVVQSHVYAMN